MVYPDIRVSADEYATETIVVVGPSDAPKCKRCDEPAEHQVFVYLEGDVISPDLEGGLELHLCGTCVARLQVETKEQYDVTIKQRGG